MSSDSHYALLGVRSDASAGEIRRAYRRLARQHHPDLNPRPDGPARFAELARAYEILSDPERRARYDQTLHPRAASQPARSQIRDRKRTGQRGTLELSLREALHLMHHPLTLTDATGRTIVLPAGTGHGDEITLIYDGRPVTLTVELQRET